ncbi:MAG: tRNA (pseudouridine(54)-N(1))-methyltransferase TrmY [Candidatus Methanoplasma sp.]|jgi:tRNA (pseudouridine54-N1)-methyltransferase|nr:tRNA (pseudouridine(54)-N(1))-methyltransferase TrmY [Candidatus Methanoplasma sp.]
MRYFVVVGHKAVTTGDFKLDDISGGAGRLDILVRCVNSAFFLSHDIRKDTQLYLVLQGGCDAPKTVRFSGDEVRYLNPDERSTSSLIRNALLKKIPEGEEMRSSPGVYVSRMSFSDVMSHLSEKGRIVYLKEDGTDIRSYALPQDPVFVISDSTDLTSEEESTLLSLSPDTISLGPHSLHADHCMVIVHNEMDRNAS